MIICFVYQYEAGWVVDKSMMETSGKPLSFLGLSTRAHGALKFHGIKYVSELLSMSSEELLEIRNFGHNCLSNVRSRLAVHGMSLRG